MKTGAGKGVIKMGGMMMTSCDEGHMPLTRQSILLFYGKADFNPHLD